MKILIYIFLNIFITQIVLSNLQVINNDVTEKIAFDFQEENEDDSEETENEKTEEKSKDKEQIKKILIHHSSDIKSKTIASHFNQNNYPSVYLNTPFTPPEINT